MPTEKKKKKEQGGSENIREKADEQNFRTEKKWTWGGRGEGKRRKGQIEEKSPASSFANMFLENSKTVQCAHYDVN